MKPYKYAFERNICKKLLKSCKPIRKFDIRRFSQFYKRYKDRSVDGTLQKFCEEYFGIDNGDYIKSLIDLQHSRHNKMKTMLMINITEIRTLLNELGFKVFRHKS